MSSKCSCSDWRHFFTESNALMKSSCRGTVDTLGRSRCRLLSPLPEGALVVSYPWSAFKNYAPKGSLVYLHTPWDVFIVWIFWNSHPVEASGKPETCPVLWTSVPLSTLPGNLLSLELGRCITLTGFTVYRHCDYSSHISLWFCLVWLWGLPGLSTEKSLKALLCPLIL